VFIFQISRKKECEGRKENNLNLKEVRKKRGKEKNLEV
jgi:hypothetical protein